MLTKKDCGGAAPYHETYADEFGYKISGYEIVKDCFGERNREIWSVTITDHFVRINHYDWSKTYPVVDTLVLELRNFQPKLEAIAKPIIDWLKQKNREDGFWLEWALLHGYREDIIDAVNSAQGHIAGHKVLLG